MVNVGRRSFEQNDPGLQCSIARSSVCFASVNCLFGPISLAIKAYLQPLSDTSEIFDEPLGTFVLDEENG